MKYLSITLSLAIVFLTSACTPRYQTVSPSVDNDKRYYPLYENRLDPGSELVQAWYHFSVEKNGERYIFKQYYPDSGQRTHYITYMDENLQTRSGRAAEWFDDGSLLYEGRYENNQRVGEWTHCNFTNPFYYQQGEYLNGEREGTWIYLDSLHQKTGEYTYRSGELEGPFRVFAQDKLVREGVYAMGEIVEDIVLDPDAETGERDVRNKPYMAVCSSETGEARQTCSDETLLTAIYSNIKYPVFAREMGIQGTAIMSFVVNKDGSISNARIRRGICKEMAAEVRRVLTYMPEWHPGQIDGKNVRVQFNLPVKFKLE